MNTERPEIGDQRSGVGVRISEVRNLMSESGGLDSHSRYSPPVTRRVLGFTLIEVMVTVAIIAIMSALLAPALRGLMGVTGPRGGMNSLASTLEQARLSGMESGKTTFVGFPFTSSDPEAAYSSFIVFRESTDEEKVATNKEFTPVSRWMRMPQGVYLESNDLGQTENVGSGTLPKLGTEEVQSLNVLRFDRFGKLMGVTTPVEIRVGQKRDPAGEFVPDPGKSYFELTVQPLTGRTIVVDKAREDER